MKKSKRPIVSEGNEPAEKKSKVSATIVEAPLENQDESDIPGKPSNQPSCFLIIKNLVRPFTIKQLISHLNGVAPDCTIEDDSFWINDIKSFCYVKYDKPSKCALILEKLNGTKWPTFSPKLLEVDYADPHIMYVDTKGKFGEDAPAAIDPEKLPQWEPEADGTPKEPEAPVEPSSIKTVDVDTIFRKTIAFPVIYWAPFKKPQKVECSSPPTKKVEAVS